MSSKQSEIEKSQQLRRDLKARLEAARDKLAEVDWKTTPVFVELLDNSIKRLDTMSLDEICPPEIRKTLLEETNSICELVERIGLNPRIDDSLREAMKLDAKPKAKPKEVKIMNKEQLKAQLLSAKEQAETDVPCMIPSLEDMLKGVEEFDEMEKGRQIALIGAAEQWIGFTRNHADKDFQKGVEEFRKVVETGDGTRSSKDSALLGYATMYAIDFASTFCAIGGGVQNLSQNSTPEEIMAIVEGITSMMRNKQDAAKCFLQSIGINSPQEAIIQLDWLKDVVLEKAKDADMPFAFAEIRDGEVHMMRDGEGGICWEKKDEKNG